MAVKKIHRLFVKFMCLWILASSSSLSDAAPERSSHNSNYPRGDFQDSTIRMNGAISSTLPDSNGEYSLYIDTNINYTCIPYTQIRPRQTNVYISLQNRERHLGGCPCSLKWNLHANRYQCFCSIPWTFRRPGEEEVKCCIDDSYQEDCINGYSFQIHFIEMTTTVRSPSVESTIQSTSKQISSSSQEIDSTDVKLSTGKPTTTTTSSSMSTTTMGATLQVSSEEKTSIPNLQTDSDGSFQKDSSTKAASMPWLLPIGTSVGVVSLAVIVLSVIKAICKSRQVPPENFDMMYSALAEG
ncbi:uncharacterized protein [Apostichopus japonicus]|uniref:uncharacterized protein isoform X1 n=1 Tax=Stichopus japonicus TaxID=307972 RepID=UPI003AB7E739